MTCSKTCSRTPLHQLNSFEGHLSFHTRLDLFELYQLLDAGTDDILIDNIEFFKSYHGQVKDLKYLQRRASPPYHRTPLPIRIAVAAHQFQTIWHNVPSTFETLLDNGGEINNEIAKWTNEKGQTLLYWLWRSYAAGLGGWRNYEKHFYRVLETQNLEIAESISNARVLLISTPFTQTHLSRSFAALSRQRRPYSSYTVDLRFLPGFS